MLRAKSLTSQFLLMRHDSKHDALENRFPLSTEAVDFIMKWNPRRENRQALLGQDAPVRHKAKRLRLRIVMQEIISLASQLMATGHRLKLKFSRYCPAYVVLDRTYSTLSL